MSALEILGLLLTSLLLVVAFDLVLALRAEERRLAHLAVDDANGPWQSRPRILDRERR